ncbi:hypothetical protein [Natrinema halophilum]|uniref:Uncharacterized protein n=1 Tax=Natrinema halophilum TaxID=1699371 RepID=A0A7D5L3I5_9EURY|nr:hypothetical protein [Natrinema halophilum]QLG50145.1 hypothetical protein HYG82_15420 [Natrinema halophilum]
MNDSRDAQSDSLDEGGVSPRLIALGAGIVDVPVFAYVSLELFDNPSFGAFVGLVVGLGTFLFLPAVITDDDERDVDDLEPTNVGTRLRGFHRAAAGLALPPAGIALFGWRFVSENLLLGILVALVIAVAIYFPLAVLLPRRLS